MRILKIYRPTKVVMYRGCKFDIPVEMFYMAVDRDGGLKAFRKQPKILDDRWVSSESTIFKGISHIAQVKLTHKKEWTISMEVIDG